MLTPYDQHLQAIKRPITSEKKILFTFVASDALNFYIAHHNMLD